MLPIKLPKEQVDQLMEDAAGGHNARITVDLVAQTITRPNGETIAFELDPFKKECLLNGLDDIGLTMKNRTRIDGFEQRDRLSKPWLYSDAATAAG